jgi:hypothetical protein
LTTWLCKKKYFCEIQRSENRLANLAKSSTERYGSKRALFPMMIMVKYKVKSIPVTGCGGP